MDTAELQSIRRDLEELQSNSSGQAFNKLISCMLKLTNQLEAYVLSQREEDEPDDIAVTFPWITED